jgi:thioredoxin-dependent peroxiredoxin
MALELGKPVPAFTLPDQDGQPVSLKDFKGSWLVIYSYPKDSTPGCTLEAKDFSCLLPRFEALGAVVIGVSRDSASSHKRFIDKQNLGLNLLTDADHQWLEAWGAWGPKKFMGREFLGVIRSTWLVDPQGCLAAQWKGVKVKGHAEEVLATLQSRITS